VIGQPCPTTFGFSADPVTHDEALVGVALQLNGFKVIELAPDTAQGGGVGAGGFHPQVELWQTRKLREIDSRTVCCTAGCAGRGKIVVRDDSVYKVKL